MKTYFTIFILLFLISLRLTLSTKTPRLEIIPVSEKVLNFIFRENGKERFEMPKKDPFPFHKSIKGTNRNIEFSKEYSYELIESPYSFKVKRHSTNETIFSTEGFNIIFMENYAEITISIPSKYLFGLGERTSSLRYRPGVYTIYNRDSYGNIEDGMGGNNRYGSHPMYLVREVSGNYHVVYLRNSHPMDVVVNQVGEKYLLTYRITGGVLDFSIFFGDINPENSIKMYHEFLGKHTLPPFWSLGFHQSRWGYRDLETLHDVLQKYSDCKIPLDTLWMDIDYMIDYVPFTVDEGRYNIDTFKFYLEKYKKKFVMIAEPAMSISWPDYEYLVKAEELDIFIKNKDGKYLINNVWPGPCYFFYYFHINMPKYWYEALDKLHEKLNFSGVWLDMNEIATFTPGQIDENGNIISCDDDTYFPYLPGNQLLERNTICPNAIHYDGHKHYQVHNYNSVAQQMHTFKFLENKFPDEFPFILSRANAAGTNKWSFHWSGDNESTFEFYKGSLSEVISSGISGIPMNGADICGFAKNPKSEAFCAKFYQIGSLYPFSRSHSALDTIRKEPWMMGELLLNTTKKSLNFRYSILKYYYSLFISNAGSGTVFKPVFFNFYEKDIESLSDNVLDNQFMIGEELMAIPNFNIDDDNYKVIAYFPEGSWFDLRNNTAVHSTKGINYFKIKTVLNEMPAVFLRGGKIIFTNNMENVENTYDLDSNFNFLISFNSSEDKVLISEGKIPAITNYHSKKRINECIDHNCWIDIRSVYNSDEGILNINFKKAQFFSEDYHPIKIHSLRVYGVDLTGKSLHSTNNSNYVENHCRLFTVVPTDNNKIVSKYAYKQGFLKEKTDQFSIDVINSSYFIVNLSPELEITKEGLTIELTFK